MNRWILLQRFSIAMIILITVALISAAISTLFFDDMPKFLTLLFGLSGGFALGSLIGMLFVHYALTSFMRANTRPETLDDILRSRRG